MPPSSRPPATFDDRGLFIRPVASDRVGPMHDDAEPVLAILEPQLDAVGLEQLHRKLFGVEGFDARTPGPGNAESGSMPRIIGPERDAADATLSATTPAGRPS